MDYGAFGGPGAGMDCASAFDTGNAAFRAPPSDRVVNALH